MMRRRLGVAVGLGAATVLWSSVALASPPDPGFDTTFGTDGVATVEVGDSYTYPVGSHSLYLQPDAKIVVSGFSDHGGGDHVALIRLDQSGVLDPNFGLGGQVTTSVGSSSDLGIAVTGQADGKLIVAGKSWESNDDFAVLRYGPTGILDPTFGVGGRVTTSVGPGSDEARAVLVQPDGAIVVAGSASNGSNNDFAVVRYTANGSLDASFGTGGKVTTPVGTFDDNALSMARRPNGSLVVVGATSLNTGSDIALVAYTSTGTLDSGFGTGGTVTMSAASGNGQESANAVAIQADGRIVIAGHAAGDFVLARYLANGTLDPSFGAGGVVLTSLSSGHDEVNDLAIRADGKIVVGGYTGTGFAVARYLPDGTLDNTFGEGGVLIADLSSYETIQAVALDAQERIVVAGDIRLGSGDHIAVARYHPDGRIPQPQSPPPPPPPPPPSPSPSPSIDEPSTTTTVPSPPTSAPDTTLPSPPAAAAPGTYEVLVAGELVQAEQTVEQDGTVVITNDDFSLAVQTDQGAGLRLSGQGYEPGSQVQAWLFSTPTYLGAATVDDDGSFEFEAALNDIDSGAHTLHLTGTAVGGETRTVTVGIVVPQPGAPTPLPGELPSTGADAVAVWSALLAVVAGVALVRRARHPMHRQDSGHRTAG